MTRVASNRTADYWKDAASSVIAHPPHKREQGAVSAVEDGCLVASFHEERNGSFTADAKPESEPATFESRKIACSNSGRFLYGLSADHVQKLLEVDRHSTRTVLSMAADYADPPTWSPEGQSLAFGAPDFVGPAEFGTHVVVVSVTA